MRSHPRNTEALSKGYKGRMGDRDRLKKYETPKANAALPPLILPISAMC
jgi:hypothetical protein